MKILNFVDMHGSVKVLSKIKEMAENADLIICAGDFSVWGRAQEAILRQFNSLKKPFIIIQGNHESDAEVNGFCKEFKNLNYAHKRLLNVGEFLIVGYGDGGCKSFKEFLDKYKPLFYVCGHLHENWGRKQLYKNQTLIINPGPFGKIVE